MHCFSELFTCHVHGPHQPQQDQDVYKQRLDAKGKPIKEAQKLDVKATKRETPPVDLATTCGTCYGAEDQAGQCCNTCDEVGARRGG